MTRENQPSYKMVAPRLAPPKLERTAQLKAGFVARLKSDTLVQRFGRDQNGSTAMIFGLMIAPVMMLTGMAVDFSRMVTVKARMQTAIDAAALAGAKAAQLTSVNVGSVAQTAAANYYNAIPMPFVVSKSLSNVTMDSSQTQLGWTSTTWVKTPFLSIAALLGNKAAAADAPPGCTGGWWVCQKVVTKASTTVQSGGSNTGYDIETSFMLDITGSMNGQKLTDLKAAATDAVNILVWADQSKFKSRVAITPFAQDVRLPSLAAYQLATGSAPSNNTKQVGRYWFGQNSSEYCVVERTGPNKYTDAAPSAGNYSMQEWMYTGWGTSCDVDTSAAAQPLTTDKASLANMIAGLQTAGGTAGHIGTAWAWYMLSPNFNDLWATANKAAAYDTTYNVNTNVGDKSKIKLKKIAILMTDGDYNQEYTSNGTMDYFGGSPVNDSSSTQAAALCTNMKAKGVEVYTVAFSAGGGLSGTAQTLLTNCATDVNHFYNAATGDSLRAAFRDIALKISYVRITE